MSIENANNALGETATAIITERFPDEAPRLLAGETFDQAGLSSLDIVELIVYLKKTYALPLDGDELELRSTTVDLVRLLADAGIPS